VSIFFRPMGALQTKYVWYSYGKKHFTRSGYEAAKALFPNPDPLLTFDLRGKRYVVTGANRGLGKEVARYLAERHATVYLICRNAERGAQVIEEMKTQMAGSDVHLLVADCSLRTDILRVAAVLEASEPHLDGVVCNAGAMLHRRQLTSEGHEMTFATQLLYGLYALGQLLTPLLSRCPGQEGRLIAVSGGEMYQTSLWIHDLENGQYNGVQAYARVKRAQVSIIERWAAESSDVTYVSCNPGWADTPGVDASMPCFKKKLGTEFRTTWQGAEGIAWLCVAPRTELRSGEFYLDRSVAPKHLPRLKTIAPSASVDFLVKRLAKISDI